jgi:hypothetical protein
MTTPRSILRRGIRPAVWLRDPARQCAVPGEHAAFPERGRALAARIRSSRPQAGPARVAAGVNLPLDGHCHVGQDWRDSGVLRSRVG